MLRIVPILPVLALGLASFVSRASAQTGFIQTSGTHNYNDTGNWDLGTINGLWGSGLTLTTAQAATFAADTVLTTGLTFNYGGNFALVLRSDGLANRTLTLGGDISIATAASNGNVTIGSSAANQNLNVNLSGASRTMSVASGRILNFSNTVSNGSIHKTGLGQLTLSSANTFAGGVTLGGGTLLLGNNASLGSGALTITSGTITVNATRTTTNNNLQNWNGDFTYGGGGTWNTGSGAVTMNGNRAVTVSSSSLTVGGAIGDSGSGFSLTKNGAGTMTLSGANTYSGGTIINGGILQFGTGAVPSAGDITINSAGILNANNALASLTTWLGKVTSNSTGVLALTGDRSENLDFSGHTNLMLGATAASIYSGSLTTSGSAYNLGGGGSTLTVTSVLAGGGKSLVVGNSNSTGAVILTGANTYTGSTLLSSGSLSFSGATASSASSAITANAGTVLTFSSTGVGVTGTTRAASVTLKGASLNVLGNSGANSNDTITGALIAGAPTTYGFAGANTVTVTADPATNAVLTSGSLARVDNGAVFFRGTNLGANTIASNTAGTSNIVFTSAPTLVGGGGTAGDKNISIIPWAVGASTVSGFPTGFVTYDANGIRVLSASEYDTTIPAAASTNNVMLDGTSLTTNGATLLTANGATTVNSLFLKNGTISGQNTSSTILAGTGALTVTSGAIYIDLTNGGNNNSTVISKPIEFGLVQGSIGTMGTSQSKNLSFSGGISGSGGVMIYDTGVTSSTQAGVSFGVANTYTGNTVINGSLIVSNGNALPNFTNASRTGDVYVNGTLGVGGNTTIRMNGLYGNGRIITPFSSNATVLVGDNNATSMFEGTITQTSGAVSLTKIGTGTLTLAGSGNNYTGATTVSAGTLLINGRIGNTAVSVASVGTLGGAGDGLTTGIIGGATTLLVGAKLSPGTAAGLAGNLTFSNGLNLSASSNDTGAYIFNLNAVGLSDKITLTSGVANALNVGTLDAADFTFLTGVGFGAGTYVLFDAASVIAGSIGTSFVDFGGGITGTLSIDAINNDVLLTVVPEPSTMLLLTGGLMAVTLLRRRRHNS